MKIGAHMSVAGGLHLAIERIQQVTGTALQIFTRNQRQWQAKEITSDEALEFQKAWQNWGDYPIFAHGSYLVNLASTKADLQEKSVKALAAELDRCYALGITNLVIHPGSFGKGTLEHGCTLVAQNIDKAFGLTKNKNCNILLETTAGQGTSIGAKFSEISEIIAQTKNRDRLGVCLDTCHIFAAGYNFRTKEKYQEVVNIFAKEIGFERLQLIHLNDSKTDCGSRVDRHQHIGQGYIGLDGFELLLNHPYIQTIPIIIETPKEKDLQQDIVNLSTIYKLIKRP